MKQDLIANIRKALDRAYDYGKHGDPDWLDVAMKFEQHVRQDIRLKAWAEEAVAYLGGFDADAQQAEELAASGSVVLGEP